LAALKGIYPGLPREKERALERAFSRDCRSYEVTFEEIRPGIVGGNSATVFARTTYACRPVNGQSMQASQMDDVFELRRSGSAWLIDRMGALESR
jgi:hypothetical protein